MIARRPRAPVPRRIAWSATASSASLGELQLHAVHLEQLAVLLHQRVARLGEDLDERVLVERRHRRDDRQAADELGDQPELDQVFGHRVGEALGRLEVVLRADLGAEAQPAACRPGRR